MSGRVIYARRINWLRVSRSAKTLGFFALISTGEKSRSVSRGVPREFSGAIK